MLSRNVVSLTTALAIFDLTRAACVMHNKLDDVEAQKAEGVPDTLCTPGGDGEFQFAMVVSQVSVPTFDSGSALAGLAGSEGFVIFDSQCVPLAAYGPEGEGNDCGVPYEMNYIEGKPLVVNSINWNVADPSFSFDFDGQHRTSWGEECGGCNTYYTDGGLRPVQQCKCGFYVGTCTLDNVQDQPMEYPETKDALCIPPPLGSGHYRLSLDTRFSTIGLYDSECHSVGTYRVGPEELAAGCALPMKINYFGDDRIITIRHLATDVYADGWNVDDPAFMFGFEGRTYGSTDDWCADCKGQGSDDELNQGCMCGFYGGA
ncbi:hypothetical protein LTR22_014889 [Elasticomyces elasticus]|nr:hypothetical protein LTR22_014889 [Elasticomyces elasticus]KAK4914348.1 hypothetical protein LTR49_017379 [Elasticomyces elasticus]